MDESLLFSSSSTKIPLIQNSVNDLNYGSYNNYHKQEIITELKKLLYLSGPLIVVSFLQYSLQMISIMFVGRIDELSLSSASIATSFAGVTGFSFMLGMGSALETLCGQAYGAKQYHMLGVYMQRAMLVLILLSNPISLIWACTGQILTILKQDHEIALYSGIYARWLIPSIIPYAFLQCQLRFLQSQNKVWALVFSTSFTSLFHVLVCWIFIFQLGFGSKGAAVAISISYSINVLILAIYIKYSPSCQKTWAGFSMEGTKDLLSFLKLGVPSALMVCLEFWSYETLVFLSGLLPNPTLELSVMSTSLNTSQLLFRISYGLGNAVSTRVSNELGAGRPYAARLAVRIVIVLAVIEGLSMCLIMVGIRDVWGYLFTDQKEVVVYLASVMPVLVIGYFMDGMQGILSGAARGCGWQKIGAIVNLIAFYPVGLPVAITLTFVFHFSAMGLWIGMISGSSLQAFLLLIITLRTDWEQQAKKAKDRIDASAD